MVNKIKVLIGDDSVEYGIACASTLRGLGMYAVTRPKDGGVLFETIKNDMPDGYRCRRDFASYGRNRAY